MALTPDQQAQLDTLLAEKDAPPYRTSSGIAGVLHHLADVVSGVVAHVSPEQWAAVHDEIEAAAGDGGDQGDEGGAEPGPASSPAE
jgi:hypothetical protein